ncbi:aryl-alcohol dehydrogenase-like predicted oxidoreductase [Aliiruegeria haliotis]|uniref:Aryl-alcohol dehydrogenase-like predicted oxidoreductase n=1 Tax=Aliiruegeria haliotis TaxID=1280846 RepID=A0A2T0RUV1_9RHOB|nr:aldo/keto reductase [Aliiruegeria haliotis]PRY24918.1 aryl-alcohol dehydrogenase-like predicted oxidoreductase [Aliiruegeria haliotis]
MQKHPLGTSALEVSDLCLGTMTFGTQTPEVDAHRQIDMALAAGINFIDTAEMYPVNPVRAENIGKTEEIIGNWIATSGRRDDIVLATKITGANGGICREGRGIDAETLIEAVDGSLQRLKTDVIDLYQLHWPNRGSYHFRQYWDFDPSTQNRAETEANMVLVLEALGRLQRQGKIREVGLSNESAWGTSEWLRLATQTGGPRMISIQNEYSLMCRLFDTDLAELCVNERVGLLAYSPLATGLLTGKYLDGKVPEGSRMDINAALGGRNTPRSAAAVAAYVGIAQARGLDPVHMALAFCRSRPFMGSAIFGATTSEQLQRILAGRDLVLDAETLKDINEAHRGHPMPY